MGGPMAYFAPGNRSHTAWAMTCAVECRRTCSPSGSPARTGAASPSSDGTNVRSTSSPPSRAATASGAPDSHLPAARHGHGGGDVVRPAAAGGGTGDGVAGDARRSTDLGQGPGGRTRSAPGRRVQRPRPPPGEEGSTGTRGCRCVHLHRPAHDGSYGLRAGDRYRVGLGVCAHGTAADHGSDQLSQQHERSLLDTVVLRWLVVRPELLPGGGEGTALRGSGAHH